MRERTPQELAIFQFVIGLAWGGALLWVKDEYGWDSRQVIWMVIALLFFVTAFNSWDIRRRLAKIEKRLDERNDPGRSST